MNEELEKRLNRFQKEKAKIYQAQRELTAAVEKRFPLGSIVRVLYGNCKKPFDAVVLGFSGEDVRIENIKTKKDYYVGQFHILD